MDERDPVEEALDGLVAEDALGAYVRLLGAGGCDRTDAADSLGISDGLAETLLEQGLAHVKPGGAGNPPRLVPTPPDLALDAALARLGQRLTDDMERLAAGHRRLLGLQRPHASTEPSGGMGHLVEIVTAREEISRLSYALINAAKRDWCTLDNVVLETPVEETTGFAPLPAFNGAVQCRAIYETACVEHPVGAQTIEAAVSGGEQARVLPRLPMKMKLVDQSIAMLPLTPSGMEGALVLRSPVIVAALRDYFEMLWETAAPVYGPTRDREHPGGLNTKQEQILRLLAQGLQDDAIATRMGLSTVTVRRHISDVTRLLRTKSRFAAGAAAVRRGWLD